MKTKFGKSFKRVLSTGLTAAMLASFATFAPVTSFAAIKTDNVVKTRDEFTVEAGNDIAWTETGFTANDNGPIMIDFDFTASSTDFAYRFMFRDTKSRDYGHMMLAPNGKVVLCTNGGTPYNLTVSTESLPVRGYYGADYQANTKHHMTIVCDINGNPNGAVGHKTSFDYYMDGKYLYTGTTKFFEDGGDNNSDVVKAQADEVLAKMYVSPAYPSVKNDEQASLSVTGENGVLKSLKIENIVVRDADTYTYLQNDDPVVENNSVKIKFSETLAAANAGDYTSGNDLSGIKIKSIDGKEVTGVTATVKNEYLTVNYTGKLDSGKTYYVVLPKNFKSADEKVLESNTIPFTAPVSGEELYVNSRSFKTSEIGATSVNDYGQITSEKQIVDASKMGSGHEAALKVTSNVKDTKYVRYEQFDDTNYGFSDEVVVYTDYYFDKLGRTGNITLINKDNVNYGSYFFDSYGHFVVLTRVEWTAADCENPQEYGSSVKAASDKIETGKWYTIKSIINQKDLTVKYYLGYIGEDNQYAEHYVTTAPVLSSKYAAGEAVNHFREIRIATLYGGDAEKWKFGEFYIDNVKVGYIIEENSVVSQAKKTDSFDFSSVAGVANTGGKTVYTAENDKIPDNYILNTDVTVNDNAFKTGVNGSGATTYNYFRLETADNETKNVDNETSISNVIKGYGFLFAFYEDGTMKIDNGLLNWYNGADIYAEEVYKFDPTKTTQTFNLKLLMNSETEKMSLFVNNMFVKEYAITPLPGRTKNYVTTCPGAATLYKSVVSKVKTEAEIKFSDTKVISFSEMNQPADIVLTDSTNKNYNIFDGAIPADIASVTIKYNTEFADGTDVSGAKLQAKGEDEVLTDVEDYTAALSADKKSIVISKDDGVLANGTYVINISDVKGADNFKTEFTVNDSRNLTVTGFKVSKDGEFYYPELKANNYSTADKKFTVIICEYSNDNLPKLNQIGFKEVTVSDRGKMTIDKSYADANGLTLTNVGENSTVKAFVWDSLGSNIPLLNAVPYVAE